MISKQGSWRFGGKYLVITSKYSTSAMFGILVICIAFVNGQGPLQQVTPAVGTSGGSPIAYGGFGGFQGSFLYEPFGRDASQLFVGCYKTIWSTTVNPVTNQPYLQFSLIAKKDSPISFQHCWQFCMFKNPRTSNWFKANYIAMLTGGQQCLCFDGLLQRYQNVPIATCSAPCTGISNEACKDNTMQVYAPCYAGFYRTPYCEAQCPGVKCVFKEYPNSPFENFFTTFCSTLDGNCIVGCNNGKSQCPVYSPLCGLIGGRPNFNMKDGQKYLKPDTWTQEARLNTLNGIFAGRNTKVECYTLSHFTDRVLPQVVSTNTQAQPWYNQVIALTTATGYGKMYILQKRQVLSQTGMQSQVVASFELQDFGFPKANVYQIDVGDVNEYGEQLLTMGQGTYFGFGLDRNARTNADCHIYNYRTDDANTGFQWAYTDINPTNASFRSGDLLTSHYVEPGSKNFQDAKPIDRYLVAEILLSNVYVCSYACAQKACNCDGTCQFGCAAGFLDSKCTTRCPTGTFGMYCRYPCSPYCKNNMCNPENGICTLGCSNIGLKGAYCTELCEPGTYGDNCLQQCSKNCDNPIQCSYLDGTCLNGCKAGYYGAKCDIPCVSGTFGVNCSTPCGSCKNNAGCDRFTGVCPSGCDGKKVPPMCTCIRGFFGDKCQYKCGSCVTGRVCDGIDGCCVVDPNILVSNGQKTVAIIISSTNDTYRDIYTIYPITTTSTTTSTTTKPPTTNGTTSKVATGSTTTTTLIARGNREATTFADTDAPPGQMVDVSMPSTTFYQDLRPASLVGGSTWGPQSGITGWYAQLGQGNSVVYNVSNQTPGGDRIIIMITPDRPTITYGNVTLYVPYDSELENMAVNDVSLRNTLRKLLNDINVTSNTGMVPCGDNPPEPSVCTDPTLQSPSCVCQKGFYGFDCSSLCGYCNGVNCKHENGYCFGGCQPGYITPFCKIKCPPGFYGDCSKPCGQCAANMTCDNANGACSSGCVKGYKPPLCQTCLDNYYDVNCSKRCGSCLSGAICNYTTGLCNSGCIAGREAPFCWCAIGFWGPDTINPDICKNKCGNCKNSTGCDPRNGKCLYGCAAGYTTEWCNQTCPAGFYGDNCGIGCGRCFNKSACDPIYGSCPSGCDGNFRPSKCICAKGTFLDTCVPCGNCANGTQCNADTGECQSGCQIGFRTPMCVCRSKTWTVICSKKCGECADNADCDLLTGECANGCAIGYTGKMCVDLCPDGTHGKNCLEKCGQCANCQTCDPFTGFCFQGCKPGYFPQLCVRECPDQTFGPLCKGLCGRCINGEPCRKSDGKCLNGCMKGWAPPFCSEGCPKNFYGANCLSTCGNCAKQESCNVIDGTCPLGCLPGFAEPYCVDKTVPSTGKSLKVCEKNYYGGNCQFTCGHCWKDNCDVVTGLCVEGCKPGYYPLQCMVPCSDGFYGLNCGHKCGYCFDRLETCRHTDGLCGSGCQPYWFGLDCNYRSFEEYQASLVAVGGELHAASSELRIPLQHFVVVLLLTMTL